MLYSRNIIGILFITVLFSQAEKGREQPRSIPKKFIDGFVVEPIKNQTQFQSQINIDKEAIPLGEPIHRVFTHNSRGLADTLDWGTPGTVNFGFFPGDVMMEVYRAPTDLIMLGVGVDIYVWNSIVQHLHLKSKFGALELVVIRIYPMEQPIQIRFLIAMVG